MVKDGSVEPTLLPLFSEEAFYLREFRGRSLGFVIRGRDTIDASYLLDVFERLRANETRVVCFSDTAKAFEELDGISIVAADRPQIEVCVWRQLRKASLVGVVVRPKHGKGRKAGLKKEGSPNSLRELALRLGLAKVVWIDSRAALRGANGRRLSFVDLEGLRKIMEQPAHGDEKARPFLDECETLLEAGVQSISLCSAKGLSDELFSFSGSGTLFTRGKYVTVRPLILDDFDAAQSFILRGVEDGFLLPRSEKQIDSILACGFGGFIEERFLAGIGALLIDERSGAAEIAALYTLTRFMGGVGSHLVGYAVEKARERGLDYVYACTTSPKVGSFFERNRFVSVASKALPAAKWKSYPRERREKLLCFRRDC